MDNDALALVFFLIARRTSALEGLALAWLPPFLALGRDGFLFGIRLRKKVVSVVPSCLIC